ncbi:hypothetical protein V493_07683 [Pseudogymnoascus sp. VKM F-4281 (FW-2241)]|nr:hypothetical protein V493_07683 [Pseudogymnoascus sp. VKM F-4281 (FW-2241)]
MAREAPSKEKATVRSAGSHTRTAGKSAHEPTRSAAAKAFESATKRHKELEDIYNERLSRLNELNVPDANQDDVRKASDEVNAASAAFNKSLEGLNSNLNVVDAKEAAKAVNATKPEPMVVVKDEPVEETNPGG